MVQVSKLLTNVAICEYSQKQFHLSLVFSLMAFGLGINDRAKAVFWISKSLSALGCKKEARGLAAWYCRIEPNGKTGLFRREFNLSEAEDASPSSAIAWIDGSSPSMIAVASQIDNPFFQKKENRFWLDLKEQGNKLFGEKKTEAARECYLKALSVCPFIQGLAKDTSFLTSNLGAAWLSITNSPVDMIKGALYMLAAAVIHPPNGRAWVRVSRFLKNTVDGTEFLESAVSALSECCFEIPFFSECTDCTSALKTINAELNGFKSRCKSKIKVAKISDLPTERSEDRVLDEDIANAEKAYQMYSMMAIHATGEKAEEMKKMAGPTMNRELIDYSTEFMQYCSVPEGLDKIFVRKILYRSYVSDRLHPWLHAMGWRLSWTEDGTTGDLSSALMDSDDLLKRWHGTASIDKIVNHPEIYAKVGAIVDIRELKPPTSYDSRIRSNFVNCPHRREVFYRGTTHLAIGFNDLNSLINCVWMDTSEAEYIGQPFRFVGIEMNPFNIAKSLVVTEMLSKPDVPLTNVLQVWYSTVWSTATLRHFKISIQAVLDKNEKGLSPHRCDSWRENGMYVARNVSDLKVRSYLYHWLSVESMSYKEARRQFIKWLDIVVNENIKMFHQISSCKRRKDRIALAHYCLTGEVFGAQFKPDSTNAVASPTFFQCPDGSPPLDEESIFNTFSIEDIMDSFNKDRSMNIVQTFESRVTHLLGSLRSKLVQGHVTVELYAGIVKPLSERDGHDIVKFIAAKVKPYSIGWSNVIDYMPLDKLHELGRAMSSHGDVAHYAYSMNWPTETYGANIFDYQMRNNFEAANNILDLALGENFGGNNVAENNVFQLCAVAAGADSLFYCPDWDTPMNSTSYVACQMTKDSWVEYFFQKAGAPKTRERCSGQRRGLSGFAECPLYADGSIDWVGPWPPGPQATFDAPTLPTIIDLSAPMCARLMCDWAVFDFHMAFSTPKKRKLRKSDT
ncbi:hypothetical protein THAOC_35095 [Thalassiosira oceanica]|uniref:Uncharacterized protein n=1 Tax=Thalassiosira oceanica TaxID=159749 RepID=K0R2F5_THAOC|nr:hypothetical protein THAOC_35095 [Thalassiosira oceanica]|eukprot:EJK46250.1 hypothetical protein THAOC_35095 [Thalassiosira oceanica]